MQDPWVHQLQRSLSGLAKIGIGFGIALGGFGLWPLYYALQRPGRWDYEALTAGVIFVSVGFSLVMLGVRALRAPKSKVLVDLKTRTVRVIDPKLDTTAPTDALQPLKIEHRVVTTRVNNSTQRTSWYAVHSPAFDRIKLFDSPDKAQASAWAMRLGQLAATPNSIGELTYDERAMRNARKVLRLETEGVLWRAAPDAVDGHIDSRTFHTVLGRELDAQGSPVTRFLGGPLFGGAALLALIAVSIRCAVLAFEFAGEQGAIAIAAAVLGALSALWLKGLPGAAFAMLLGGALVAKTVLDPVVRTSTYSGKSYTLGLTSETHLMLNGPGLILIVLGVFLLFTGRKRKAPPPPQATS